jgi:hypothetical protein
LEKKKSGNKAEMENRSREEIQASNGRKSGGQDGGPATGHAKMGLERPTVPVHMNEEVNRAVHLDYRRQVTEDASQARSETMAPDYEMTLPFRGRKGDAVDGKSHDNYTGASMDTD